MIPTNTPTDFPLNEKKYIVIETKYFEAFNEKYPETPEELARLILKHPEAVLHYQPNTEEEFFVIKLKDTFARPALQAYARNAVIFNLRTLGQAVSRLAERAGLMSKHEKFPD